MTAVIAAAGSGERLGAGGPKAFVPLAGRPMIEWSLDAFGASEAVGASVIAVPPGADLDFGGDVRVVEGGSTRAHSVANALAAVETELVAIHDAARPLVTGELVDDLVAALDSEAGAAGVIAATPVTDTVKESNRAFGSQYDQKAQFEVERTVDRSRLWAAQTPQVFRTEALRAALEVDASTHDAATDEAMLVEAAGGRVLIHPTSAENFKVTTPLDLRLAELLLAERSVPQ
ncbi:MAG TPA: 2-C-methyl-D-erythritol 4-phosphate cytidylyltransferase [Solirubrobacterales bacterium]|nr:2-C-methyl-D-erythritol 4-phosphate cytidylyltransferase [Solirubrobacterales bacterium]